MGLGLCHLWSSGADGNVGIDYLYSNRYGTDYTDGRHSRLTASHDCVAEAVACFRLNHATGNLS